MEILMPERTKLEKSTPSNNNKLAFQTTDGTYNIIGAHTIGKRHAKIASNKITEKTTLMNGTKMPFNSTPHKDKEPYAYKSKGAVAICAAKDTDANESTADCALPHKLKEIGVFLKTGFARARSSKRRQFLAPICIIFNNLSIAKRNGLANKAIPKHAIKES